LAGTLRRTARPRYLTLVVVSSLRIATFRQVTFRTELVSLTKRKLRPAMHSPPSPGKAAQLRKALIIDDHPLFCDALSMTLRAFLGLSEVDTADRLQAAVAKIDGGARPDVILLDLNLPDVDGMEGLVQLRRTARHVPIIVVSSLADARVIAAALRAGADGFVPKHSPREVFRAAFEALAEGRVFTPESYVSPDGDSGPSSPHEEAVARLSLLTRQQTRILQLICEGRLNKQIAFDLSIAETTVKAHVTAIMRKLGVQSRTQAVLLAKQATFASLLPENTNPA
jgi:DNA-binding NarL/FixJ family response regulator